MDGELKKLKIEAFKDLEYNEKTDEFEVKGPWLLDWHVNSEFPELAATVVRLEDASSLAVLTDRSITNPT